MSRLVERLRRTAQGAGGGLGFLGQPRQGPPMVLVALSGNPRKARPSLDAGADAFLLRPTGPEAVREVEGTLGDREVWGLWIGEGGEMPSSCDFCVAGEEAPLSLLEGRGSGTLIALKGVPPPEVLRGASALPVDAFLLEAPLPLPLTARGLAGVAGLAALLRRPLLAVVEGAPSPWEVARLRDAGLAGLCLDLDRAPEEALSNLRSALDRLEPAPARRPAPALGPTLPFGPPTPAPQEEDGEEEEGPD